MSSDDVPVSLGDKDEDDTTTRNRTTSSSSSLGSRSPSTSPTRRSRRRSSSTSSKSSLSSRSRSPSSSSPVRSVTDSSFQQSSFIETPSKRSKEEKVSVSAPSSPMISRRPPPKVDKDKEDSGEDEEADSDDDEEVMAPRRGKKAVIADDSSDDDDDGGDKVGHESPSKDNDDDDQEEEVSSSTQKKKKRIAVNLDSDSDNEGDAAEESDSVKVAVKSKEVKGDSSSSDEGVDDPHPQKQKKQNVQKQDSSSSSDEGVDDPDPMARKRRDSNSSSDGSIVDSAVHDKKGRRRGESKKEVGLHRKSKKAALDEIHSESSRLLRETAISLPYHRPKPRTLEEFMNRKKGAPEVMGQIKMNINAMSLDESEKLLEIREKMAQDFYKEQAGHDADMSNDDEDDDDDYDPTKPDGMSTSLVEAETQGETSLLETKEDEGKGRPADDSGILSAGGAPSDDSASTSDDDKGPVKDPLPTIIEEPAAAAAAADEEANDVATEEEDDAEEDHSKPVADLPGDEAAPAADSESMHLFLSEAFTEPWNEPDSTETAGQEEEEDNSIISSSQKQAHDSTMSVKKTPLLAKRFVALGGKFDLSTLNTTLAVTPKLGAGLHLSGSGDLILDDEEDLDDNPQEQKSALMERFVKHVRADLAPRPEVSEEDVNLTIVRKEVDEDGHCLLKTENLKYHSSNKLVQSAKKNSDRPGAKHLVLRQALKEKIAASKRQERVKREEMKRMENEDGGEEGGLEDEIEEDLEDEEESEEDEEVEDDGDDDEADEYEDEDEEGETRVKERKGRVRNAFLDDEAEDDDDRDNDDDDGEENMDQLALEDDDDDSQSEGEGCFGTKLPKSPPPQQGENPMLEDARNLSAQFDRSGISSLLDQSSGTQSGGARKKLGFEELFDRSDPNVSDMDDLVGLCSGQFLTQNIPSTAILTQAADDSQRHFGTERETQDTVILSNSIRSSNDIGQEEEQEEEEQAQPGFMEEKVGFLQDSDDEVEDPAEVLARKKKRIILSDDEDEEDEEDDQAEEGKEDDDEDEEQEGADEEGAEEEGDVEYDSDENEVVVQKPKFQGFVGKKGLRKEFIEQEAELSGSDDGSEDEDERGLNRLEMEEGDLDDLDQDEIRDELGKIHQRRLLDEDKRDVRLFKEAFLEDGDLHSDQARARRFKWSGIDDNEELERRLSDDEGGRDVNEEEEKRRLDRLEREKWLQESKKDKASLPTDEEDPAVVEEDSQFFSVASKAMKKLERRNEMKRQISKESSNSNNGKTSKVFKSPEAKRPLQQLSCNPRGSFLSRGAETLEKLAEMTRGKDADARTGSGAKNSKNFVFAAIRRVEKDAEETGDNEEGNKNKDGISDARAGRKQKSNSNTSKLEPVKKKPKIDRTLDENSSGTIFGLM